MASVAYNNTVFGCAIRSLRLGRHHRLLVLAHLRYQQLRISDDHRGAQSGFDGSACRIGGAWQVPRPSASSSDENPCRKHVCIFGQLQKSQTATSPAGQQIELRERGAAWHRSDEALSLAYHISITLKLFRGLLNFAESRTPKNPLAAPVDCDLDRAPKHDVAVGKKNMRKRPFT